MCLFQKTKELNGSTKYQKNFLTSRPKHKKKQQQLQQPHEAAEKKDVVEQQLFFGKHSFIFAYKRVLFC